MLIALSERFQRDAIGLSTEERAGILDVVLALPKGIGQPHVHSGLGIRKLHPSGYYEARLGLARRLVFKLERRVLTLVLVGTHDDVRRYLREL